MQAFHCFMYSICHAVFQVETVHNAHAPLQQGNSNNKSTLRSTLSLLVPGAAGKIWLEYETKLLVREEQDDTADQSDGEQNTADCYIGILYTFVGNPCCNVVARECQQSVKVLNGRVMHT